MKKILAPALGLLCVLSLGFSAFAEEKKEKSFKEKVADSVPLSERAGLHRAGADLKVTHLYMEKPYIKGFFSHGPISLRIEDNTMTVLFRSEVHRLQLPKQAGGKLTYDETFGEGGVMPYDRDKGWQPVEKLSNGDKVLSLPLGDLVGEATKSPFHQLVLTDKGGSEVARLGAEDGDGKICWFKNACRYKDLVFIIDSNCRSLDVWTVQGRFLFDIKMKELGLDYPWPMSIDITDAGELYLGYTQERKKKVGGRRNSDVTESAFVKISGLDQIDPQQAKPTKD